MDVSREQARARVTADLMEDLLARIDFARLEDAHGPEVRRMTHEVVARATMRVESKPMLRVVFITFPCSKEEKRVLSITRRRV